MAYTKHNFENGSVLTAEQLNRMEEGIREASETAEALMQAKESGELNGRDGQDGSNGEDGTSVTVKSVSESTADGGSNVVTFSDGKTLTVKNGSKGSTGDKGDKGDKGDTGSSGTNGKDGSNGVSATHSWNGTVLTVTSASGTSSADLKGEKGDKGDKGDTGATGATGPAGADGAKGDKGDKGDTGATGSKGDTGVSVSTVKQTTTSSADGGSNVVTVTLSNGTTSTFTVKNGSKGSTGSKGADGYTPVRGTDYWTTADKEAMIQDVISALGGTPIFGVVDADNNIILSGNLADGVYTVKYEDAEGTVTEIGDITIGPEPTFTNLIPLSINADGTPFNGGRGWKTGYRLNSSGTETAQTGIECTGFMPATKTDKLYFGNIEWPYTASEGQYCYFTIYDSAFTTIGSLRLNTIGGRNDGFSYDSNNNAISVDLYKLNDYNGWTTAIAYVRISAIGITDDSIITKNEPIE